MAGRDWQHFARLWRHHACVKRKRRRERRARACAPRKQKRALPKGKARFLVRGSNTYLLYRNKYCVPIFSQFFPILPERRF